MKPTFIALLALCLGLSGCGKKEVGPGEEKLSETIGTTSINPVTPIWEFETGSVVNSSPAIGSDGTIYVGSWDKKLYAIKTDSKGVAKSPWPMRGQNAQHTGRALKK